ncbi:MAG: dockerin type I repeat-containing protein [Firmicutes bacterium]|nr:dockerin type I repeat-containing protein [Bacillota bacterium]
MKFKTILGAAIALGTIMLASVTAHAATYSAAAVSGGAGQTVLVPITVKADTTSVNTVNGYIIEATYDASLASVVQLGDATNQSLITSDDADYTSQLSKAASDDFAVPGTFSNDGVFVSGNLTSGNSGKAVVAWANASAKTVTDEQTLAYLAFTVADEVGSATEIPVTITLKQLSADGTSANDTANTVQGTINLASVLLGDVNGDGSVTLGDATVIMKHKGGVEGFATLTETQQTAADVNLDGAVTLGDATIIMKHKGGVEGYETLPHTGK